MAALEIKKYANGTFAHTLDGNYAESIIDNAPNATSIGNVFNFKTKNGANIVQKQFIRYDEITYIDVANVDYIFANVQEVWLKLIDEDYFLGLNQSGGGGGTDRFDDLLDTFSYIGNDGKVPVVDQSQLKLVPVTFYNFNEFKQLEDVDISAFVANKIIGVNDTGDKLVLLDPPADPVELVNAIGFFNIADVTTQTTPISYTTGAGVVITNDGAGTGSTSLYRPYGVSSIWDPSTNRFDFNQLTLGDEIILRVDVKVTTTLVNQTVIINLVIGEGTADELTFRVVDKYYKNIVTDEPITANIKFFIGSELRRTNPAKLIFLSKDNDDATLKTSSFQPTIIRKSVNVVDIPSDNTKEDLANKTDVVVGNEASTSLYLSVLGAWMYFQQKLTDVIFGTFINALTAKTTPVNADYTIFMDSADSNKAKKISWANINTALSSSVLTTEKTLLSSDITTKDVDGMVVYINALSPTVTVASSETVKFRITDTGQVFELKLHGVTVGLAQTPITASDLIETGFDYWANPVFKRFIVESRGDSVLTVTGGAVLTATGTANTISGGSGLYASLIAKTGVTSTAATAGSSAEYRDAGFQYFNFTAGFKMSFKFSNSDAATVADARCFYGCIPSNSATANVNPSTLLGIFGVGSDNSEANLSVMHNDGSGTATKIPLGANFPANTTKVDVYSAEFWVYPGTTSLYYEITRLNTGHVATGKITTDLSTSGSYAPHFWRNNGATALAVNFTFLSYNVKIPV